MEQVSLGTITLHVPKHGDDSSHLEFHDTSFFKSANSNLPSAAEVLQRYRKDSESFYGIAFFRELALVVKFGQPSHVHLDNALTMRALWQAFPNREVPVPEVFGWRSENNKNFIYMSLIPGKTLYEVWTTLSSSEKESICKDLGSIQSCLRRLRPESGESFIGMSVYVIGS
jgi:aminoglycoside phosphotransferase